MPTSATAPAAKDYDDSPYFRSVASDAEKNLAALIHENGTGVDALLSVYQQIEEQSRDRLGHAELLMTAILAGERVITTLSRDDERTPAVLLSLADLLVRRSNWDSGARILDLERAVLLNEDALSYARDAPTRFIALQKLSAFHEDKYMRTGSQQELMQAIQHLQEAAQLADPMERSVLLASVACLHFKVQPDALKCILEIPIQQLPKIPVSWSDVAHKKFRFIDARTLAAGKSLRVVEFDALPRQRYVALSYVWHGLSREGAEPPSLGTMFIEGAVGADPISIDVLVTVGMCVATLNCELLWIDGVCIIQDNQEDKGWQIQNMFDIYKHCKECLVLPGGLSRLVGLGEPTSWIHRAWTLQEAVAPESCTCLFAWDKGDCILQTHMPMAIREVVPNKAAKADLFSLLSMSMMVNIRIVKPTASDTPNSLDSIKILINKGEDNQGTALLGAHDYRGGADGFENAIWRAALTRVASRPADAVFSIMGLLGVTLDPLSFNENDRKGPTVALMQALLRKGDRAEWLGAAPNLDINPDIATLPNFPTVSPEGKALAVTSDGPKPISEAMGDSWWSLADAPRGSMQDNGTLTIHDISILPIRHEQHDPTDPEIRPAGYHPYDGRPLGSDVWYPAPMESGPPYIVQLGRKKPYLNAARAMFVFSRPFLVMLVSGAEEGKVRVLKYASVGQDIIDLPGWRNKTIVIAPTTYDRNSRKGDEAYC